MKITSVTSDPATQNKFMTDSARNGRENGSFSEILRATINKNENGTGAVKKEKLMDLCVQMESIFVSKMLKTMRNTVEKGDFIHGGFAEEIFEDMLYDEYSLSLSKNSDLGIAKMLYEELGRY